jgi:hypothetical protein
MMDIGQSTRQIWLIHCLPGGASLRSKSAYAAYGDFIRNMLI